MNAILHAVPLAIPFPDFDPVAVQLGPFAIRWYALAYIAGLFGGLFYAKRLAADEMLWAGIRRPTAAELDDLLLYATLGVILGGRIAYVLFYQPGHFLANPIDIFAIWSGGMSFHGGFAGVILAVALFARARGLSILSLLDLLATVTPIGLLLGRIANFVNGELWGRPTDMPWGVVFPHAEPAVARHPSQLYEAATEGLILLVALAIIARSGGYRRPGLVGGLFVAGYALSRIFCEFFREPDRQLGFLFGGFATMGMLLSLPMLIVGLVFAIRAKPIA